MALDMDALGSSLFCWEIGGYIATAIVVIGVIGESVVEFTDWIKSPQTLSRVGIASALILVIGLAGEILTQVKVNSISGRMIAFLNSEAANAIKAAGILGVTMDNLEAFTKQKTGEIGLAIADLNAATVRAQTKLAEIEDRNLSPEQIREIADELNSFAGARVLVGSYKGDNEAARIGEKIVAALTAAHIQVLNALGFGEPDPKGGGLSFGIHISGLSSDEALTTALKRSLGAPNRLGVDPDVRPTLIPVDGISVHIMVAIKPPAAR